MKIYTKTGDDGTTGLFGGARVDKCDPRVEAYGTVDEANAAIGLARAQGVGQDLDAELARVQSDLFRVGAELACVPEKLDKLPMALVTDSDILRLERAIDTLDDRLPALKSFILPGGCPQASGLHLARTVCRRAERLVLTMRNLTVVRAEVLRYLNRLSDLLFVMARAENQREHVVDVPWEPRAE